MRELRLLMVLAVGVFALAAVAWRFVLSSGDAYVTAKSENACSSLRQGMDARIEALELRVTEQADRLKTLEARKD